MTEEAANSGAEAQTQPTQQPEVKAPATEPATPADAPAAEPTAAKADEVDWRAKLANGDDKELKRLARFASEADVWKAYRELEKKKSSGELKTPFPKDGTPEEITLWRKENGIPEAPDKYDLTLDNGIVIGEEDKPLIDKFVSAMHGTNATNEQLKAALNAYYSITAEQQQAMEAADVDFQDSALAELQSEWGGEYKRNINVLNNFISSAPDTVKEMINSARYDGKVIGDHPDFVKWMTSLAFDINPAATVMPGSINNPSSAIADEIASIEGLIKARDDAYWKSPEKQQRYQQLIDARDKISAKG
ncbi:MAG: hypothetical protein EB117_09270 [Betaproteobacteria bacterium]|nr:hypothetical protein [Betaproteobacteria bacterium]